MTGTDPLPQAVRPLVAFSGVLRANGFRVAPDQTQTFIAASGLLGPRSIADIYRAALASLAPPPERRAEFDALFRLVFHGQSVASPTTAESDDDDLEAFDQGDGTDDTLEDDEVTESGAEASVAERLTARQFGAGSERETLMHLRRRATTDLPMRKARRRQAARTGDRADRVRALREAVRRDGELLTLPALKRQIRQRRIVLLIDISGSMKAQTESHLRFAHTLQHAAEHCEVFTLGTRLTRVSRALRLRHREQALQAASGLVADWDGGTRLGDALTAFLDVPRFAGMARGALTVVLSDGLERGDPQALIAAVERLSRLSWATLWLTPLAGETDFLPQTEALVAVLPLIDRLGSGADLMSITDEVLNFARRAA
ncbi:MAG: VWA domain-containing protein [Pseudomonadota bacterium]